MGPREMTGHFGMRVRCPGSWSASSDPQGQESCPCPGNLPRQTRTLQQDETDLSFMTVLRYHTFLPERRVRKSVSHHGTLWHHRAPGGRSLRRRHGFHHPHGHLSRHPWAVWPRKDRGHDSPFESQVGDGVRSPVLLCPWPVKDTKICLLFCSILDRFPRSMAIWICTEALRFLPLDTPGLRAENSADPGPHVANKTASDGRARKSW